MNERPSLGQMITATLLAALVGMPFGLAASIGTRYMTRSAVLAFLTTLLVIQPIQMFLAPRFSRRLVARGKRRQAREAERRNIMAAEAEVRRSLEPWYAARVANRGDDGGRRWLEEVEAKALRLADEGRRSLSPVVVEALVDLEKNLPALTADYMRARNASGERGREALDRDYLEAVERIEGSLDGALSVLETEVRGAFDTRLRHLQSRIGDQSLGPVPDPR